MKGNLSRFFNLEDSTLEISLNVSCVGHMTASLDRELWPEMIGIKNLIANADM